MHMEKLLCWSRVRERKIFRPVPIRSDAPKHLQAQIGVQRAIVIPGATDCADIAAIPYICRIGNL